MLRQSVIVNGRKGALIFTLGTDQGHDQYREMSEMVFEEVVEQIGESSAHDLEAKTKMLQVDAIKLYAREPNLIAEFFEILADDMMDD